MLCRSFLTYLFCHMYKYRGHYSNSYQLFPVGLCNHINTALSADCEFIWVAVGSDKWYLSDKIFRYHSSPMKPLPLFFSYHLLREWSEVLQYCPQVIIYWNTHFMLMQFYNTGKCSVTAHTTAGGSDKVQELFRNRWGVMTVKFKIPVIWDVMQHCWVSSSTALKWICSAFLFKSGSRLLELHALENNLVQGQV